MNLEKIKEIAEKKKITLKKLAQEIGMSEPNLYRCFKRNSIETKHIEKIALTLGVSIPELFGYINPEGETAHLKYNNRIIKQHIARLQKLDAEIKEKEKELEQLKLEMEFEKDTIALLQDLTPDE